MDIPQIYSKKINTKPIKISSIIYGIKKLQRIIFQSLLFDFLKGK